MGPTRARIIKRSDAVNSMEGVEHCREYVREPQMWFGTSTVPAGQHGDVDPGHQGSVEVFFCASGHVLVFDGEHYDELEAGDALLIPEGLSHQIFNIGDDAAVVVWAGAPGE